MRQIPSALIFRWLAVDDDLLKRWNLRSHPLGAFEPDEVQRSRIILERCNQSRPTFAGNLLDIRNNPLQLNGYRI